MRLRWITWLLLLLIQMASLVLPAMRLRSTRQPLPARLMPVKFGSAALPLAARPIRLLTNWQRSTLLDTVDDTLMPENSAPPITLRSARLLPPTIRLPLALTPIEIADRPAPGRATPATLPPN